MLIEVMNKIINIIQLVSALALIAAILIQQRGSGLGGVFGGDNSIYRTKRGAEKIIFIATIILAVLFIGASLAAVFLNK